MTVREIRTMFDPGGTRLDVYLREFENGASIECDSFITFRDGETTRRVRCPAMLFVYERAEFDAAADDSLEWAAIAVRAANIWALDDDDWNRKQALQRCMQLRANLICKSGARTGHPILDRESILTWFKESLIQPINAVRMKTARWKAREVGQDGLTLPELRELRTLKMNLKVLKTLADCGQISVAFPGRSGWISTANCLEGSSLWTCPNSSRLNTSEPKHHWSPPSSTREGAAPRPLISAAAVREISPACG